MLIGFQVAGTIRNCCFEAKNQLQNILLISEFLWPALLLPVAGSKVCYCSCFIAATLLLKKVFFLYEKTVFDYWVLLSLDIQWARYRKNATWAWKCTFHWARTSYWSWHSRSDSRSYIFDHLRGITFIYLAFPSCELLWRTHQTQNLQKVLWYVKTTFDVAGGRSKGILVSQRATDSTSGIRIWGRSKSNESLWASRFFGMFTPSNVTHALTLHD